RAFDAVAEDPRTLVFFEAPTRTEQTLRDMAQVFGNDRRGAVCRELTKLYEQVVRGTLSELADWAAGGVRGEVVLVVAGAPDVAWTLEKALAGVQARVSAGSRLKDATREVAASSGISARDLYDAAVAAK
ncbi:MAG: SAM-dependent methyltransferase, partial [Microbacterium gubbeenense]